MAAIQTSTMDIHMEPILDLTLTGMSMKMQTVTRSETIMTPLYQIVTNNKNRIVEPIGTQQRHICTISTESYDCQIQRVNLKHDDVYDFGLEHRNNQQNITFSDSVLQYLPKSLIVAFPNMKLLNLNHLNIETIEDGAFDSASNLETLFLEGNRLQTLSDGVLRGAPKLRTLVLTDNDINTMPNIFKNNRFLSHVYVNQNKLTKLPKFDDLTGLKELHASRNDLEQIEYRQFSKQPQIEIIDLSYNRLNDLQLHLPMTGLDLIDVSYNQLINLNIPLTMKRLIAQNNSLSTFRVTGQCSLKVLDIHNNKIQEQPKLSACYQLEILDLSNNFQEFFEFSPSLMNLKYLNLAGNNLFEILLPTKSNNPPALNTLILSYNKLSYLPSLSPFKSLNKVDLNDNNLIAIRNYDMPKSLTFLFVSNNEWRCDDVPKFSKLAKDTKNAYCPNEFLKINGVCCKHYAKAFNDKLNEKIRDSYFHEQINLDKLKKNCAHTTKHERNDDLQIILQAASRADKNKNEVLVKMEEARKNIALLQQNSEVENQNRAQISNFKRNMALAIDKKRKHYRVTKEGLIDDKEMLSRIVKFVEERGAFTKDLLNRRVQETEETDQILAQKGREKEELLAIIAQQTASLQEMKKQERDLKKKMETLQKKVNRNAPAIHGKTGTS
ncbi:uncharacterized protein LOC134211317 isoform X2 [Armigeres subalbatus]|uniref:uncharacterized protein LOC134211317 isoform X2 n=1 Tax=Armigeres subalbatus TaxID=124917 RepID=UPI002ED38540